jgi:endo-1,3-1,4-beta-glycanase ExoK
MTWQESRKKAQTMTRAGPLAAALALGLAGATGSRADATAGASFLDAFDTFDPARWYISDGWTNGPHQNCWWSKNAIKVQPGEVTLQFLPTGQTDRPYLCGEIQTNAVFGYGTYEARFRTDVGSGINAAFFTYIGPVHKQPHDEIDFEVLTRDTSQVSVNTYVNAEPRHGASVPLPEPSEAGFLTYSFVWAPGRLRWYVEGKLVHEVRGNDLPTHPQKIYLSHWGSDTLTNWMGPFADPGRPLNMVVDWVAFTAPGEGCAFAASVLCTDALMNEAGSP